MPLVQLSDGLFARAQAHAVPLVDDLESVIHRAFDALEKLQQKENLNFVHGEGQAVKPYNPKAPPNLAFSQPTSIKIDGEAMPYGQLYWNTLMFKVIGKAVEAGYSGENLRALLVVPSVLGEKDDHGYKPLKGAGLSVQGQAANGAWKQTCHLAEQMGVKIDVIWMWQKHEKAALPGQKGSFTIA